MDNSEYTVIILDTKAYPANGMSPGFIEYTCRFTNTTNPADTFDGRVDGDGSEPDLTNQIRKFLLARFPAAPTNQVPNSNTYTFAVGADVTLVS